MSDITNTYDPKEHMAGSKYVKSAWVLVLFVNMGLVLFTI